MYRMVDCGTWDDPWFESLEPQGKLFFLYLLTNPRSTSCNLVTACKPCNRSKRAKLVEDWVR